MVQSFRGELHVERWKVAEGRGNSGRLSGGQVGVDVLVLAVKEVDRDLRSDRPWSLERTARV